MGPKWPALDPNSNPSSTHGSQRPAPTVRLALPPTVCVDMQNLVLFQSNAKLFVLCLYILHVIPTFLSKVNVFHVWQCVTSGMEKWLFFQRIMLLPCHLGALSGWMRYKGYDLAGHTQKEEPAMATVEDCWGACLQGTGFSCMSVAYAEAGSQSCLLYDKKALSVYRDWTSFPDFTYYEYCVGGEWYILM